MKVKDLIAALQEFDEDMEVVVDSSGEDDLSLEKDIFTEEIEVYDWNKVEVYPKHTRFSGRLEEESKKKYVIKVLRVY